MAEKNPQPASHLVPVGPLAPGQRWSLARKREVALRLLRAELAGERVEVYRLERWKDKALAGLDAGLKERVERLAAQEPQRHLTLAGKAPALPRSEWAHGDEVTLGL